jgi:hypothetical protein
MTFPPTRECPGEIPLSVFVANAGQMAVWLAATPEAAAQFSAWRNGLYAPIDKQETTGADVEHICAHMAHMAEYLLATAGYGPQTPADLS